MRPAASVAGQRAAELPWGRILVVGSSGVQSKNFPASFSFGPLLVPLDEIRAGLAEIEVQTVHNGSVRRRNTVANMTFPPEFLMSLHSKVMPLFPGDIISTETPGAVVITAGDVVECRIPDVGSLRNLVVSSEGNVR